MPGQPPYVSLWLLGAEVSCHTQKIWQTFPWNKNVGFGGVWPNMSRQSGAINSLVSCLFRVCTGSWQQKTPRAVFTQWLALPHLKQAPGEVLLCSISLLLLTLVSQGYCQELEFLSWITFLLHFLNTIFIISLKSLRTIYLLSIPDLVTSFRLNFETYTEG